MRFFAFLAVLLYGSFACAQSGLPIPRFVSLRSNQVNLRTGPGLRYPVEWVYLKNDLPVEIIAEFDTWRQIRDFNGREGWIHQPMLSGRRTVRITEEALLLRAASLGALPLAKVEKDAIGHLIACPKNTSLCKVEFGRFQGWMNRKALWGVYPDEVLE